MGRLRQLFLEKTINKNLWCHHRFRPLTVFLIVKRNEFTSEHVVLQMDWHKRRLHLKVEFVGHDLSIRRRFLRLALLTRVVNLTRLLLLVGSRLRTRRRGIMSMVSYMVRILVAALMMTRL